MSRELKSERDRKLILVGISAAAFLGPFSQTVYVPSLPEIGAFLHATTLMANLTISIFTAMMAVSSFVIGPMADARGRRTVLLPALAAFAIGSMMCLFAQNYWVFLAGRLVQAIGASAGSVVAAAVIGDIYAPKDRARVMSIYQLLVFLGPVFGPVVGGVVAGYLNWHWAFGIVIAAVAVTLGYNWQRLPETLAAGSTGSRLTLEGVRTVVRNASSRSILLIGFSQFYGYYLFMVFLPLLLTTRFSLTAAERGFAFLPLTAGILGGLIGAKRWLADWPGTRCVRVSSYGVAINVMVLCLLEATDFLSLPLLVLALLAYGLLLGGSLPAQSTILVNLFDKDRAAAMGVYNFARFGGAAAGPLLGAYIAGHFGNTAMMLSLGVMLLLAAWVIQRDVYDPYEKAA